MEHGASPGMPRAFAALRGSQRAAKMERCASPRDAHAGNGRRVPPLDATDAAHFLDDLPIAEVFGEAGAGAACAKPALDVHDDLGDAAYRHVRVVARNRSARTSPPRDRYELLVDPAKLRLQRTGAFEPDRRRLQIVDRGASRRSDAERLRRELGHDRPDVTGEGKLVQCSRSMRMPDRRHTLGSAMQAPPTSTAPTTSQGSGERSIAGRSPVGAQSKQIQSLYLTMKHTVEYGIRYSERSCESEVTLGGGQSRREKPWNSRNRSE